uniref:Cholinergic receptor nicotinic beta 3 subunit n=1 Tax=Salmo trutta TaxID=8032 RepID=A0A674A206_SALTR
QTPPKDTHFQLYTSLLEEFQLSEFGSLAEMEGLLLRNLFQGYQRWVRPIQHANDTVTVRFGLQISQLLDVDEKNQLMTTNVWLWQGLYYKLRWNPEDYGGITSIGVLSETVRLPDIVADGRFEGSLTSKAIAKSNPKVTWTPPASYKSACTMDVTFFPFAQTKPLLRQRREILNARGNRWDGSYSFPFITYSFILNRLPLFYTLFIIPCLGLSFLTMLVLYLLSDEGEKLSLSTSVLVSLTVFLLVIEIIPSSSKVLPDERDDLLFIMIFVTLSVIVTVFVINVHHRSSTSYHPMSPWVRSLFLQKLARMLCMRGHTDRYHYPELAPESPDLLEGKEDESQAWVTVLERGRHFRKKHFISEVVQDWKFVAQVLDSIFLWASLTVSALGTILIFTPAPHMFLSIPPQSGPSTPL